MEKYELIDVTHDPTKEKDQNVVLVIVKDQLLLQAEQTLRAKLAADKGMEQALSFPTERAAFKGAGRKVFEGTFGFMDVVSDIQELRKYARNCHWARRVLQTQDKETITEESDTIFEAMDFDGNAKVQIWEVRIIFERAGLKNAVIPTWLEKLFHDSQ